MKSKMSDFILFSNVELPNVNENQCRRLKKSTLNFYICAKFSRKISQKCVIKCFSQIIKYFFQKQFMFSFPCFESKKRKSFVEIC